MLKTALVFVSKRKLSFSKVKYLSPTANPQPQEKIQSFRSVEHDPLKHTYNHVGQFYNISKEDRNHLFNYGGLPKTYLTQAKTFNETCVMIRQPTIDVIECLKNIDYAKPAVRFVIYGKKGSGKSLSMAHILHYANRSNFLVVHVPWVGNWMRRCQEVSNSDTKEGFINLNVDAAAWLLHFKTQNSHLLEKEDLKIAQDYVWSKREKTEKGSPLLDIVNHGINRIKFASDCVVIIADEIKKLSNSGVCKTLVAIDGFNAFFYPNTRVFTEKKEKVHPHKVVITEAFLNLTKNDWKNSAVIVTVDEIAVAEEDQISHMPRYLLGKEGFEHLDPFVPIPMENYNQKEFKSVMDYYRDRRWITPYPGQDEEVSALSANNPYNLIKVCAPL
ncbi:unnamed protein product [Brassicogethes aeneus]|uniref:Small ribosomal subunit protein mS29 n=1 Tax=Brassicogethes aeneus TaxID=1431903 RepID=A0A9P0APS8_BRAAE|nr:unnamed protein product [Brassicogethes aeneus]